jgi:hypothetical protein
MQLMLRAPFALDALNDLLDLLNAIFGRHEHSIFGLNDNVVSKADRRHQTTLGEHETALRIVRKHITAQRVARVITLSRYTLERLVNNQWVTLIDSLAAPVNPDPQIMKEIYVNANNWLRTNGYKDDAFKRAA